MSTHTLPPIVEFDDEPNDDGHRTVTVTQLFIDGPVDRAEFTYAYSPGLQTVVVPERTPEFVVDALETEGQLAVWEATKQNEHPTL